MSATTLAIAEEIETLATDIENAKRDGQDASLLEARLRELSGRLIKANEQLEKKQVLRG